MLAFRCSLRRLAGQFPVASRVKPLPRTKLFSDWTARGHDLLHDSLTHGSRPKIVLEVWFTILFRGESLAEKAHVRIANVYLFFRRDMHPLDLMF